jgi:hypothetical protein
MATTTTAKSQWTDYAILQPSSPQFNKRGEPVKWKVQINQHGQFRCGCPSFIFSKVLPRSCKHTRRCEQEQALGMKATPMPTEGPFAAKSFTAQAAVAIENHPQYASAVTIASAMLDDARVKVSTDQMHKMCAVLALKLAAFVPAPRPAFVAAPTQVTRLIVFDD